MYKKILIPVDNSIYSNYSIDIGLSIASKFGSEITACHVYAARLHDMRFSDMETCLPKRYDEEKLDTQRQIHGSLIEKGLKLISESYLDVVGKKCAVLNIPFQPRLIEGKNHVELIKDIQSNSYNLIVMGAVGLGSQDLNGEVLPGMLGSVCDRIVRNINENILVVKDNNHIGQKLVVCIDGSNYSFSSLERAIRIAKVFDAKIEAISVYDPYFHTVAFKGLTKVLSDDAKKVFRFKEQECLHDEIINTGLRKVYKGYLDRALEIARAKAFDIETTLLSGKATTEILKHIHVKKPSLLIAGRFGAHMTGEVDIGGTVYNLLRYATCNILIT